MDEVKKPSKKETEVANAIQRFKAMPGAKVREELARLGIDPQPTIDAVKVIVANAAAKLEERKAQARRSHHETAEILKPISRFSLANRRRLTRKATTAILKKDALRRDFFSIASTGGEMGSPALSWHATHRASQLLRDAFRCGPNVRATFIVASTQLSDVASKLRVCASDDLDALWPFAEAVVETGAEAARDACLWDDFSTWFAGAAASSPPTLQCMFVHALRQLFVLGPDARELATISALETLRRDPSPEARMLLIRFAHHNDQLQSAGRNLLGIVDTETRRTFSEIDAAKHDALQNFPKLRRQRAERGFFCTSSVATLMAALREDTLSRLLAMDALAEVYLCAATLIAQDPKPRQKEQHAIFAARIAQQLRDEPRFLTIGSLELVRDRYPRFAALLLASLVDGALDEVRAAIFVCVAVGYERSFAGETQARTPTFQLDADAPSFRAATPHALDVFGHRVCESACAEELRQNMRWLNQRLERWARAE
ncbi:MAG TPA: hypothetical protein VF824_08935 [Thermoanaerobaculia bacterium]